MRAPSVLASVAAIVAVACGFFPEVGDVRQEGTSPPGASSGDVADGGSSGGTSGGGTSGGGTSGGGTSSGGTSSGGAPNDGGGGDASGPRTWTVMVAPGDNERFDPRNLKIKAGDTVRWLWAYGGHNVISDTGLFCSPNDTNCGSAPEQPKGAVYTRTFPSPGVFPYHCGPHEDDGMRGTITVE